jgi:hypothetical protein
VGEDFQPQFAALTPSGTAAGECFQPAFDHGDHRFHLDAIAIGGEVESRLHQSAVAAAGWLGGGPTMFGGDEGTDAAVPTSERMIGLGIKAGVGCDAANPHARERSRHLRPKVSDVGCGATAFPRGEDEMRLHIANHAQFGIAMINDGFPGAADVLPPTHEVAAGDARFHPGRVDGRATHPLLAAHVRSDRGVQEASGRRGGQQSAGRFCSVVKWGTAPSFSTSNSDGQSAR